MTALKTPAPDAHASEWGALAVSIPGWRWPISTDPRDLAVRLPGFVREKNHWHWVDDIFEEMPCIISTRLGIVQRAECVPDPDHWAWWGWFIELLQPIGFGVGTDEDGVCNVSLWETDEDGTSHEGTGRTIGRACIAAAAANGRWPGGEG